MAIQGAPPDLDLDRFERKARTWYLAALATAIWHMQRDLGACVRCLMAEVRTSDDLRRFTGNADEASRLLRGGGLGIIRLKGVPEDARAFDLGRADAAYWSSPQLLRLLGLRVMAREKPPVRLPRRD